MRVLNLFLILLMFTSLGFSISLEIEGKIQEYSTIYQEHLQIEIECNEEITLNVPKKAFEILFNEQKTKKTSFNVHDCSRKNSLTYKTKIIEDLGNERFRLERNFKNYNNINYTYNLVLPFEYNFDANNSLPLKKSLSYSKSYKIIHFNKSELFVLYFDKIDTESKSLSVDSFKEEFTEIDVIILLLSSFLLGAGIMYLFMNKKIKELPSKEIPSYVLSKEEKSVIEIIKHNKGINQKQISLKLDVSKSKISAIVTDLEQKKLIKREKFGRSFKVYLNKKIV